METKFAVALLLGDEEKILGTFNTKPEADMYATEHRHDISEGLQYCFSSLFIGDEPRGDSIRIYNYYNLSSDYNGRYAS